MWPLRKGATLAQYSLLIKMGHAVRWGIRYQLLLPLALLLAAVVGLSVWMALAAADRAWAQIETRARDVARFAAEPRSFSLSVNVLRMVKELSGADCLLKPDGDRLTTLSKDVEAPGVSVCEDWRDFRLGPPVIVLGQGYLCGAIHLRSGPDAGRTLYILYPESLWKDARREAAWPFVILGGSAGVASLVLAFGLGQRLAGRVLELERRTRQIAAGDFGPMPVPRRNDEVRDLTESINDMAERLARLQEAVRRAERMRLLGQVSGGLAHQLRNGLTGARLAVQLYLRESAGQTDTAALDVALRQLALLEARLKRFLDLGRQDDLRREPCSLTALVGEVVELLRPQCKHAGIDLRWQPPMREQIVVGDAGQLGQLVHNLVGNAVEAAGLGGWVEVSIGTSGKRDNGRPENGDAGHSIVLTVTDSGPGPPPAVAERLFEPFVTGKLEGVGLGLAVARQAAEAHAGRISWSRSEGQTIFRVEFPMTRDQ